MYSVCVRTPQLLEAAGLHELRPQQPQLVHELVLGGRSARPAAPTSGIILLRTVNDLSPTFSQYSSIPCAVQCVHGAGAGEHRTIVLLPFIAASIII